jgi:hypothetical protein
MHGGGGVVGRGEEVTISEQRRAKDGSGGRDQLMRSLPSSERRKGRRGK